MLAFAIKCICIECKYSKNPMWLSRAENPGPGAVSFPLIGLFQGVEKDKRLLWKYEETAKAILEAIKIETMNPDSGESKDHYEVVPVSHPDNKVIGRFQGY